MSKTPYDIGALSRIRNEKDSYPWSWPILDRLDWSRGWRDADERIAIDAVRRSYGIPLLGPLIKEDAQ